MTWICGGAVLLLGVVFVITMCRMAAAGDRLNEAIYGSVDYIDGRLH